MSDSGIGEILEEWKLFYPQRFEMEASSGLPAAIEVVLGGVRMRYPSQVHTYGVHALGRRGGGRGLAFALYAGFQGHTHFDRASPTPFSLGGGKEAYPCVVCRRGHASPAPCSLGDYPCVLCSLQERRGHASPAPPLGPWEGGGEGGVSPISVPSCVVCVCVSWRRPASPAPLLPGRQEHGRSDAGNMDHS